MQEGRKTERKMHRKFVLEIEGGWEKSRETFSDLKSRKKEKKILNARKKEEGKTTI